MKPKQEISWTKGKEFLFKVLRCALGIKWPNMGYTNPFLLRSKNYLQTVKETLKNELDKVKRTLVLKAKICFQSQMFLELAVKLYNLCDPLENTKMEFHTKVSNLDILHAYELNNVVGRKISDELGPG